MLSVKSIQTNFKNSIIRCKIANIQEAITNISVNGLIIGKQEPKFFAQKTGSLRKGVLTITIRDSNIDFINVSCWGTEDYILNLNELLQIHSIIQLRNPQINSKVDKSNENKQHYKPWTPSLYELELSERSSDIFIFDDKEALALNKLTSKPIRDPNDYFKLEDIILNGRNFENKFVNLLFVVKKMNPIEDYISKQNITLQKLELTIFDETNPGIKLIMWDRELIKYAHTWEIKNQVIFGVDLKISYDSYKKCMFVSTTRKTLFIPNPEIEDACALYGFIKNKNSDLDIDSEFLEQIAENCKVEDLKIMQENGNFNCLNYNLSAYVSDFNIDFAPQKNVIKRCSNCNTLIDLLTETCLNTNCSEVNKPSKNLKILFNIRISITDDTGTLSNIRVDSKVIEAVLGISPNQYLEMEQSDIINLKWKLLLEKRDMTIKVGSNQSENDGLIYNLRITQIKEL